MKTSHTPGNWETPRFNKKQITIQIPFGDKIQIANCDSNEIISESEAQANAKLISCAPEMLDALIKANDELKSIIAILDGRITNDFAKTDLGMRLSSFFKSNAFICEEKIEPIIEKATK